MSTVEHISISQCCRLTFSQLNYKLIGLYIQLSWFLFETPKKLSVKKLCWRLSPVSGKISCFLLFVKREREREPCHHVYLLVQLFNTLLLWRVEAFNIIYIFTVKLKSPIAFKTLGFSQPKHFLLISDFYCFLSRVLFLNIDSIFYTDYTLNNEIKPNSCLTAIVYL